MLELERKQVGVLAIMVAAGVLLGCQEKVPERVTTAPFGDEVFSSYTEDQYPGTIKKWGAAGIEKIKAAERLAAEKAAASGRCDQITWIGLSDSRSAPPDQPVVFVDCANGERFYVSGDASPGAAVPVSAAIKGRAEAVAECRERIREAAVLQSSVDFQFGSTAYKAFPTTGAAEVTVDFEVKNQIGNVLPYAARCLFPAGGPPEVTVAGR